MPSAVKLREDYSAEELRALARRSKDVNQSRRLLSLAAVRDGMDRGSAAKIGGMDRQTLRDWVHRFNAGGPEGLIDNWTEGPKPRLSAAQLTELASLVEAGPNRETDGVVRWRRVDLKRVIAERFGVDFHARHVGKLLKKLGFSHMSARPRHPAQDERIVEAFKTYGPPRSQGGCCRDWRLIGLLQRIRPRRFSPGQDGDTRAPVLINFPAIASRHFLNQASEAPFDCQAISSSPSRKHLLVDRCVVCDRRNSTPPRAFVSPRTVLHVAAPPKRSSPAYWRRRRSQRCDGRGL